MIQKDGRPDSADRLRQQAEELARGNAAPDTVKIAKTTPEESRRLIHELRVHQIELEMQNHELREAEAALKAEETRYFDLYELAPVGYCTVTEKGQFTEANLTLAGLLGMARNELLKRRFTQLVYKQDQDTYYLHNRKLFETATPQVCELRLVKADGSTLWARVESTMAWNREGTPVCRQTLSDVTERVRALEERESLQLQLFQLQKQESIGRLAGGVAHDFNNMLSVILGFTELAIHRVGPDAPVIGDLLEVQKAAMRSAEMTRQLLAYASKQAITPRVLDVNTALENMLGMLTRLVGENLVLEWLPCADPWPVSIDPCQIDQILTNLCLNARDAIEDVGTVRIETYRASFDADFCKRHPGHQPGDYMCLAVEDNGRGMEADTREHLFEPYFTTKAVGRGTGLGLSTVLGIVRQNRGFIILHSNLEHGSRLEIHLPRFEGNPDAGVRAPQMTSSEKGRETVLLVEDEAAIVKLCQAMLQDLGYRVLTALSPAEALDVARQESTDIDLLLTDVLMPGMNGRELARQMLVMFPGMKYLLMSGYTADIMACQGTQPEGVNFIQKPFSRVDLAAKLRRVLEDRTGSE